jgi:hypothetical protein
MPARVAVLVLFGLFACARPAPSAPSPVEAPIAAPSWPAPAVSGVPGWLGLRAGSTGEPYWTGIAGTSALVVLEGEWAAVPAGALVRMVTRAGVAPVRFVGVQRGRFGCDGGSELTVAAFDAAPSDDLAWILPAEGPVATALPVTVADTEAERVWTVGGERLGVTRTGPYTARVWAGTERIVVRTIDLTKDRMAGAELHPVDVRSDHFVPQVVAAWEVQGRVVVAATWSSFEGVHFSVFTLGATPHEYEVGYLYACAF